ncbi:MAG: methylated-DNA--[protein]-cysteine S-methyltransferase [Planctomycetota bacterium]
MDARLTITTMPSPVGVLTLGSIDAGGGPRVALVEYGHRVPAAIEGLGALHGAAIVEAATTEACPALTQLAEQLGRYFEGSLREFDLPLVIQGTPFREAVWRELLRIPYGETTSYGDIARRLGRPGAARAVGAANGANRISILVPCHRVVDASGGLHGYGGGLGRKRWLLDHESTANGGLFRPATAEAHA